MVLSSQVNGKILHLYYSNRNLPAGKEEKP